MSPRLQHWRIEGPKVLDIGDEHERVTTLAGAVGGRVDVVTHDDSPPEVTEATARRGHARASATPVGGHDTSWTYGNVGSVVDLEHAVNEFRSEFRQVWRRRGLTPEQTQEIVAILTDAGSRIRAVVARR